MPAKIYSGTTWGLEGKQVTVEVDLVRSGFIGMTIVGLPSTSVKESKDRVKSAIVNSGLNFPAKRIVVNLAPANIPKDGPKYDLPIAIGILLADGQLTANLTSSVMAGELALDGTIRPVSGILPLALMAQHLGKKQLIVSAKNADEAALVTGLKVIPVSSLKSLVNFLSGRTQILPKSNSNWLDSADSATLDEPDMADIKGQELGKRALEIAAAGGHNLFLFGEPGTGKTMLAKAYQTILPPLTHSEALEVRQLYSVVGQSENSTSFYQRPFRSPHHTISRIGLIGGGSNPLPGEISLAHRGVLFIDEFPEFPRHVLEALRQPLEDGKVNISRAAGNVSYPCRFSLIASANPCPCGYLNSSTKTCICTPNQIYRYQKRLSGPLLDRIDLFLSIPPVKVEKLIYGQATPSETSQTIQQRVIAARLIQTQRFAKLTKKEKPIHSNAELTNKQIKKYCPLSSACQSLLKTALSRLHMSTRAYYKTIRVARTIADLAQAKQIVPAHLSEALQYRQQPFRGT